MILQPIVENSVNHGIREMNGEGKIRLKVYHVDGDTLGISIRDNGIGMDPDTIEKSTWRQLSRRAVRRRFQWYCDGERYRKIKTFHAKRRCNDDFK